MLEESFIWWLCLGAAFVVLLAYILASSQKKKKSVKASKQVPVANEIEATSSEALQTSHFPGEDAIASQLDLAKAYLELGRTDLAKTLLEGLLSQANAEQRRVASSLLAQIG